MWNASLLGRKWKLPPRSFVARHCWFTIWIKFVPVRCARACVCTRWICLCVHLLRSDRLSQRTIVHNTRTNTNAGPFHLISQCDRNRNSCTTTTTSSLLWLLLLSFHWCVRLHCARATQPVASTSSSYYIGCVLISFQIFVLQIDGVRRNSKHSKLHIQIAHQRAPHRLHSSSTIDTPNMLPAVKYGRVVHVRDRIQTIVSYMKAEIMAKASSFCE